MSNIQEQINAEPVGGLWEAWEETVVNNVRMALRGDQDAASALVLLFGSISGNPGKKNRPKIKRGRPSIDSKRLSLPFGLKPTKKFFGRRPSEKNALMIAYLISQGHPINERSKTRESAPELVSSVTGRSSRSLQNDYYKNRSKISNGVSALEMGRALYESRQLLTKLKIRRRSSRPSQ